MKLKAKILLLISSITLCACNRESYYEFTAPYFEVGYSSEEIVVPENETLYIAGYHQGAEVQGFLDKQRASAMYVNDVLLISIDAIGISGDITGKIREKLKNTCENVNVFATHTHAGIDTLGLWGNVGLEGKNEHFMSNLVDAAVKAGKQATENKTKGKMYYGYHDTEGLQDDSREPVIFDSNVYQFRFVGENGSGVRLINYAAHAESLRGDNYMVSADYVGKTRDLIKETTGDDVLFVQGAIGGLIMTKELVEPFDAVQNMNETGTRLANFVLAIDNEVELNSKVKLGMKTFKTKLDNTLFFYYRFLGILKNKICRGKSMTGYMLKTEASILTIGDIAIYLMPGEIFPELVYGGTLTNEDPDTLVNLAKQNGYEKVLVFGLANDELGYIVPKSSYLLNEKAPYVATQKDETGENHYEETNSSSKDCCEDIYKVYSNIFKLFK